MLGSFSALRVGLVWILRAQPLFFDCRYPPESW